METLINKQINFESVRWINLLLPLTIFVLPISSSAKSVLFCFSLLAILLAPSYRLNIKKVMFAPYVKYTLALFLLVLLALFWSPAFIEQKLFVIEKFSKFLYLPLLVVGFQSPKARDRGLKAFILAMCFISCLSIAKYHGLLHAYAFNPDNIFRNHIMTSIMMAFAAYLSTLFCYKAIGYQKTVFIAVSILLSYQLFFVNASRTGYVIYFLLAVIFLFQVCNWKKIIIGLTALGGVFLISYLNSSVMKLRVDGAYQQLQDYKQNKKDTDIGLRLQFHNYAYHLFKRHPFLGNGTGSFTYYFAQENPVSTWNRKLLEPHNFYYFIAAEWGILGLTIFSLLFLSFFQASSRLKNMKPIAIALLCTFLIGNLSDSLLFYSGTGYFFILILSLCLGEGHQSFYNSGNTNLKSASRI